MHRRPDALRTFGFAASLFAALAVIFVAPPSLAQSLRERTAAAREIDVHQRDPQATLSVHYFHNREWLIASFYVAYSGSWRDQRRHWLARLESGRGEDRRDVSWADSRNCPGLVSALESLERLSPVYPDIIGIGGEDLPSLLMDGATVILWTRYARAGERNANVTLEVTGNLNSPAYDWWREVRATLDGCWTREEPVGLLAGRRRTD